MIVSRMKNSGVQRLCWLPYEMLRVATVSVVGVYQYVLAYFFCIEQVVRSGFQDLPYIRLSHSGVDLAMFRARTSQHQHRLFLSGKSEPPVADSATAIPDGTDRNPNFGFLTRLLDSN